MIRVVYRWRVGGEQEDDFIAAWREATGYIQAGWPGARGSVLLRSRLESDVHLAVARWESLEAWQASREGESVVPTGVVERMRAAGGAATYEVYDELCDWEVGSSGNSYAAD